MLSKEELKRLKGAMYFLNMADEITRRMIRESITEAEEYLRKHR